MRGDGEYFSEHKAFTLEPLRVDGRLALVWNGNGLIDRIVWRECEIAWPGGHKEVVIRKADNLFAAFEARGRRTVPDGGDLVRAVFDVYFVGMRKPRQVQVRLPNILKLGRHCDAGAVQQWLSDKRFREAAMADTGGRAPVSLPILPLPLPRRGLKPAVAVGTEG